MKLFGWFQSDPKLQADDRPDRIKLAEAMRQFASGTITNRELEKRAVRIGFETDTIFEMTKFTWLYYDEFSKYRLRGRFKLDKTNRQLFARCILFLRSNHEYDLPSFTQADPSRLKILILNLKCRLTSDLSAKARLDKLNSDKNKIELAIHDRFWPFSTRQDYNEALKHPVYLAGAA